MNAQVAAYEATCASLAHKVAGRGFSRRLGIEFDDLMQEGRIAVWQALDRGITPSASVIELRMFSWVRLMRAQLGQGTRSHHKDDLGLPTQHVPYESLLPLDALRVYGDD